MNMLTGIFKKYTDYFFIPGVPISWGKSEITYFCSGEHKCLYFMTSSPVVDEIFQPKQKVHSHTEQKQRKKMQPSKHKPALTKAENRWYADFQTVYFKVTFAK